METLLKIYNYKFFLKTLLLGIILSTSTMVYSAKLNLVGKVVHDNKKLEGVSLLVYDKNNNKIEHYYSNNGKYSLNLPFNKKYIIYIHKRGYDIKPIYLDNTIPEDINENDLWNKYRINFVLEIQNPNSELEKIESYRFDPQTYYNAQTFFYVPVKLGIETKKYLDNQAYLDANTNIFKIVSGLYEKKDEDYMPFEKEKKEDNIDDIETNDNFSNDNISTDYVDLLEDEQKIKKSYGTGDPISAYSVNEDINALKNKIELMTIRKEMLLIEIETNELRIELIDNPELKASLLKNTQKVKDVLIQIDLQIAQIKKDVIIKEESYHKLLRIADKKKELEEVYNRKSKNINTTPNTNRTITEEEPKQEDRKNRIELTSMNLGSYKMHEAKPIPKKPIKKSYEKSSDLISQIENNYKNSSQYRYFTDKNEYIINTYETEKGDFQIISDSEEKVKIIKDESGIIFDKDTVLNKKNSDTFKEVNKDLDWSKAYSINRQTKKGIVFSIQIAAGSTKKNISTPELIAIGEYTMTENNGMYYHCIGKYNNIDEAYEALKLIKKYVAASFPVGLENGKKISIKEAKLKLLER